MALARRGAGLVGKALGKAEDGLAGEVGAGLEDALAAGDGPEVGGPCSPGASTGSEPGRITVRWMVTDASPNPPTVISS